MKNIKTLETILTIVTAIALILVAVIPIFFSGVFHASVTFGGTSLIIIVSVTLETMKQIEALMKQRNYTGFLNS